MKNTILKLTFILTVSLFLGIGSVSASFDVRDPYGSQALAQETKTIAETSGTYGWEQPINPMQMAINLILMSMTSLMILMIMTLIKTRIAWQIDGNNLEVRQKSIKSIEAVGYGFLAVTAGVIFVAIMYYNYARIGAVLTGGLDSLIY